MLKADITFLIRYIREANLSRDECKQLIGVVNRILNSQAHGND